MFIQQTVSFVELSACQINQKFYQTLLECMYLLQKHSNRLHKKMQLLFR
jgi:hypothetical protein